MTKTPSQEHETSITYDKSPDLASVGTNILADVRWMIKHWGPPAKVYEKPTDGSTAWHIWFIPKSQAKLPRPARTVRPPSEAKKAAGRKLAASRLAQKQAKKIDGEA